MGVFGRQRPRPTGNPNGSRHNLMTSRPRSLVASGMKIEKKDGDTLRRIAQPWQARSFGYYDALGEIKYAAQFYSRALANLRLFPAELDGDGDLVETDDAEQVALLDRIQDPGGGRSGLLSSYGRLMFLAGEALLFVSRDPDTELEQWEMLSTDELRVQDGRYLRYKAPSLMAEDFREPQDDDFTPVGDNEAVAYRLWQRHPQFSMLPDSTMQGVLDLCEELVILTHAVRSRARSRLAGSGILAVSDGFSSVPLEPTGDEDLEGDPFVADLVQAMTAAITDEGSASAVVPLVVRGPLEEIKEGIRHIEIVDPTQLYPETGLRYECIKRIAIGLDMPPEILMGLQDSNHWTAWQIDEQTWKSHLQPKAQQLVDDLTSSYYRPMLREMGVSDWQRRSIGYDATAIINHPDRTKDAKDLYDKRAIGKKALRAAGGFDEEDAPTQAELAEMVGIATHDPSLAWYGIPSVRSGGIEPTPGDIVSADSPGAPAASTGADVEAGPPAQASPNDGPETETVLGGLEGQTARILGAADLGIARAREVAGNRLKGLAKRDAACLSLITGVRAGQVAHVLGPERAVGLGAPAPLQLVSGARDLVIDALRMQDVTGPLAERVADSVEIWAARTLFEERPGGLPASVGNLVASATVNGARPLVPA